MSEWIRVAERPCPVDEEVLVYGENHSLFQVSFVSVCSIGRYTRSDGTQRFYVDVPCVSGYGREIDFEVENITHWMPLPPMPTGTEK